MPDVQRVAIWPASLRETFVRRETPYRYLAPRAGYAARAAWWLLKRLNVLEPYIDTVQTWQYVPQQQGPLHEAMLEAADRYRMFDVAFGKAVFLIGGATFSELAKAPVFREQMRFVAGPFAYADRVFDIPIHVVPHMTGMAVVPRVLVETKREGA